jgi:hypothetical protein
VSREIYTSSGAQLPAAHRLPLAAPCIAEHTSPSPAKASSHAQPCMAPAASAARALLVGWLQGDQVRAQEWKTKLEDMQRRDRQLRVEGGAPADH